jgi:hypothetical protein
MNKTFAFSRRGPDVISEELVSVLSGKASFEFKPLFDIIHNNLRARNSVSGGEEMLRLRAYEKLQNLVHQGQVKKTGKQYNGVTAAILELGLKMKVFRDERARRIAAAGLEQ